MLSSVIRKPKLLAAYARGWSKKLKVASKFTPFPLKKFYFQFSSVFDKGIAKLLLTKGKKIVPPIIGR